MIAERRLAPVGKPYNGICNDARRYAAASFSVASIICASVSS
jgi:hypothetical protein